ncbi:MAG: hypothetical protein ACEY3D_05875 [Rickettsia sp.]
MKQASLSFILKGVIMSLLCHSRVGGNDIEPLYQSYTTTPS